MQVQKVNSSLPRRVVRFALWTAGCVMLVFAAAVVLLMQFAQSAQPISHRVERPGKVQTVASRQLVEVHWKPVDGATSYEVFRADSPNGHYEREPPVQWHPFCADSSNPLSRQI
jgi:hypothetical protein